MISLVYTQEIKSEVLRQTTASYSCTFFELFLRLAPADRLGLIVDPGTCTGAPLKMQNPSGPAPSDVQTGLGCAIGNAGLLESSH
ncbi:hypothetical protein [Burkholderia cenocepacia]|uniref:hypothetical protein n=1 Tax=Burkholderia cenocepacia TaxID=95486 RepID=UPI0026519E95|nr:hypothetical protein [Burkholderia cenocepacia]MDN7542588.1 hypothetical protein [Burkholderia cenocepacia]